MMMQYTVLIYSRAFILGLWSPDHHAHDVDKAIAPGTQESKLWSDIFFADCLILPAFMACNCLCFEIICAAVVAACVICNVDIEY